MPLQSALFRNDLLAYKTKRNIVNSTYQKTPDNILGKMTMASLDAEMLKKERGAVIVPQPVVVPGVTEVTVSFTLDLSLSHTTSRAGEIRHRSHVLSETPGIMG